MFVTALTVLVLVSVLVMGLCYDYYYDRSLEELKREAEYIQAGIEIDGADYLESADVEDVRVTLVDFSGKVIFDTAGETSGESYLVKDEIKRAKDVGEGVSSRVSEITGEQTLYYAVRLESGEILRVSSAHHTVFMIIASMLWPIALILLAVLVFAFVLAKRLAASIVAPINEIDLDNPDKAKTFDEIKPIIDKLSSQKHRISKQMEELKLREEEFVSITKNMSEGMIVINSFADVLSINDSARRTFAIEGEAPKNVVSLNGSQSFKEAVRAALSGKLGQDELRTEDRHYEITVTPVVSDGTVEGAVVLIIDDTEKEEREALRREFTSNISHELKTPLTSISGFAEMISTGLASAEDTVHFAENVQREAKRLMTLVGDIIKLTQLDGREIPYDGEIDLFSAAAEAVERLLPIAEVAGVTLTLQGRGAPLLGSFDVLEQMVYNLTDNAIKYNVRGGSVTVTVNADDTSAALTVSDTGIGIPKDKQPRVFERFYRVDKSRSKQIGGTGLGLSIVKHAAVYHKATINLESEPDKGTTVSVIFPKIGEPKYE